MLSSWPGEEKEASQGEFRGKRAHIFAQRSHGSCERVAWKLEPLPYAWAFASLCAFERGAEPCLACAVHDWRCYLIGHVRIC